MAVAVYQRMSDRKAARSGVIVTHFTDGGKLHGEVIRLGLRLADAGHRARQTKAPDSARARSNPLCAGCSEVGNAGEAVDGHEQVQFCEY